MHHNFGYERPILNYFRSPQTPSDHQAHFQAIILLKKRKNMLEGKYYLESEQLPIKPDSSLVESPVYASYSERV